MTAEALPAATGITVETSRRSRETEWRLLASSTHRVQHLHSVSSPHSAQPLASNKSSSSKHCWVTSSTGLYNLTETPHQGHTPPPSASPGSDQISTCNGSQVLHASVPLGLLKHRLLDYSPRVSGSVGGTQEFEFVTSYQVIYCSWCRTNEILHSFDIIPLLVSVC